MWFATFALVALGIVLGACTSEDPRRAEAMRLSDALQSMDVAGTPARQDAQLAALKSLTLTDPELDRTRDGCIRVHEGLRAAEREQAAARDALQAAARRHADGGVPAAKADSIRAAIERSEAARAKALAALPECERATRALLLELREGARRER